jgi:hypothetical protein
MYMQMCRTALFSRNFAELLDGRDQKVKKCVCTCVSQCIPASVVLKIRELSPGPMLSANAVCSSMASMSRKSSCSDAGGEMLLQLAPAVAVRRMVPWLPDTHAAS